jgi:hypothetical protein
VTFDRINAFGENIVGTNDIGLTRGKTYYYKIEAFSEAGYSPFSNTASGVAP